MINPVLYKDGYKVGHKFQYPEGTEYIYSNFTPRESRIEGIDEVVVFGIQYFIKDYLIRRFNDGFFSLPKEKAVLSYKRRIDNYLGKGSVDVSHIADLHDLGYLPLRIKALPEGTRCPLRVPTLTVVNTDPRFFWLTNFIETILSAVLWPMMTSATIAKRYKEILDEYASKTSDIPEFTQWQGHDFSMRGMMGLEAAIMSGAGHLLSFTGTDTIPAIDFLENFYNADSDKELIGGSVPATEHSVMCLGGQETEEETFNRLLTQVYPTGIVSIVSDTWDFWKVLTETLPKLKDSIMNRDGKLVIRPDSGDPVKVICGYKVVSEYGILHLENSTGGYTENLEDCVVLRDGKYYPIYMDFGGIQIGAVEVPEAEVKGAIETLWEEFGGEINSKGYKQLDSHIGLIYGDSITLKKAEEICRRLFLKWFASTNVVLGIGSYTYQYVTRDTFGFAMKSTWGVVNGKEIEIFKKPKTDSGVKNSAKGLLVVANSQNNIPQLIESVSRFEEETVGLLDVVFENGNLLVDQSLSEIRGRLNG